MTFTTRPTLTGTFGMVSSTHWLASQAAQRMLELGGNAFDAAAAGGFVLHVVEPHLNGPGGDLPAIIATAADPTPRVLCGQGPAPAGATREAFAAMGLDHVPGSGPLAAAVPGAVDAWLLLLRDHGSLPLATVLEPAIGYARAGHPLLPRVAATIERVRELFEADWSTSAEVWLPGGRAPAAGELFANPAYAATLERLVAAGPSGSVAEQAQAARRAWSEGFVAEAVDSFRSRAWRHSGGQVLPGLVGGDDLAAYSATWEPAAVADWHGLQIAKTALWGQGPTLLQVLAILDEIGPSALDPDTAEGIHTITEAWKLVMADREAWYGDASPLDVEDLLEPAYVSSRARLVGERANHELRPGSPRGLEPRLAEHVQRLLAGQETGRSADVTTGEPTVERDGTADIAGRGDTCHLDVVDRWGNIVSATPSGGWLQSSPTIPELGFCLGSRAQMFWLDEGLPASLEPGARPRTTLSPTLVLRDGVPVLACGSPGGDQQDQWQSLFLLRHVVGGMSLQEAIDAPAFHHDSFPGSFHPRGMVPGVISLEDRYADEVVDDLVRRGHDVQRADPWSLGRLCAVARDPATGVLSAGANPRGMQGYAVGR